MNQWMRVIQKSNTLYAAGKASADLALESYENVWYRCFIVRPLITMDLDKIIRVLWRA